MKKITIEMTINESEILHLYKTINEIIDAKQGNLYCWKVEEIE